MKDVITSINLTGPRWWKDVLAVEIKGDPDAADLPADVSSEERGRIIHGWKIVAVFTLEPKDAPAYVGFISGTYIGVLKYPLETLDGKFGMRIGRSDVKFFAFDPNLENEIRLTLIEVTKEDDPRYPDLPLY